MERISGDVIKGNELRGGVELKIIPVSFVSDKIYLTIETGEGLYVAKPVEFEFTKIKMNGPMQPDPSDIPPTFTISHRLTKRLFKKIAEELEKKGITTDNQTKAEAKLEVNREMAGRHENPHI